MSILDDIVVNSTVRLDRNIENYKFPQKIEENEANVLIEFLKKNILEIYDNLKVYNLKDMPENYIYSLLEEHLVTPSKDAHKKNVVLMLPSDKKMSIMINDVEHLKIQVNVKGYNLNEAWNMANSIDTAINEKVKYSYNQKLGYLTSSVSRIGTGMTAKLFIHLPALKMTNNIDNIISNINKLGVSMFEFYKGTSIYQISNRITLGISELEIINNIEAVAVKIAEQEKILREKLLQESIDLENKIYRAYGILSNSRILSIEEGAKLLSDVRFGIELGIINNIKPEKIKELEKIIMPASFRMSISTKVSEKEECVKRAEEVRKILEQGE